MRKITVYIEGASQTIDLQESIVTNRYEYMLVKKATIFWRYENVPTSFTAMTNNGNVMNMYKGYYTFNMIRELCKDSVKLEATKYDGKCKIITDGSTNVNITSKLAYLLGFNNNNRLFKLNTTTISDSRVNLNLGLEYIKIRCDVVNSSRNLDEDGDKDNTIVSLPITTTQTQYGSVQPFYDIESKIPINRGVINRLRFSVTDQNGDLVDVGKILLECYLM